MMAAAASPKPKPPQPRRQPHCASAGVATVGRLAATSAAATVFEGKFIVQLLFRLHLPCPLASATPARSPNQRHAATAVPAWERPRPEHATAPREAGRPAPLSHGLVRGTETSAI